MYKITVSLTPPLLLLSATHAWAAPKLTPIATGLSAPIFLTAPASDSRQFIIERAGKIRILKNGSLLPTPFLDITALTNTTGEHGLLGLAFSPDYATSGRFYVNYIDKTTGDTQIARYTVNPSNPDLANPATSQILLTLDQPAGQTNHKAGWIGFRPGEPNNLYIPTGDGGGSNDPGNRAQDLFSPLGKVLRINVSGSGTPTPAAGNPFLANTSTADDNVWAYGLRNPYRNSFDRQSGALILADVGQSTREEVDVILPSTPAGLNFGWRALEGSGDNPGVGDPAPANATGPTFDYLRGSHPLSPSGSASSITGGYVYRGTQVSELLGKYIFGDYVTSRFGALDFNATTGALTGFQELTSILDPTKTLFPNFTLASFGEDANGELYALNISSGIVYRIDGTPIPETTTSSLIMAFASLALLGRRRSSSKLTGYADHHVQC